jgi:peptide/nickel transport system permease protein
VGVSVIVFAMVHFTPGDPIRIMLGDDAEPAEVERLTKLYGFDQPAYVQYFKWLGRAVQGDFGHSLRQRQPVTKLIGEKMGATIELAIASLLIAVLIGVPLGVVSAVRRNSWVDYGSMGFALVGVSAPNFWIGLILLTYVALNVGWIPVFGRAEVPFVGALLGVFTGKGLVPLWDSLRYLLLPAITLATSIIALITRLTRSSMLEVLSRDYVRTAKAKGQAPRQVVYKHALRNALLPVVTVIGVQFGSLLGGAIVVETVFAWPGVGMLIINSIRTRELLIVQAAVLMLAAIFALVNLLVDFSYSLLNPRIRYA